MAAFDSRFPALLRSGTPQIGIFVTIPSPALVEMCGFGGFDFVVIDNEHGPASIETTEHLLRAARCTGAIPIVRTFEPEIPRLLDAGASGVQVPLVDSAEQAARIVRACRYYPAGARGAAYTTRAGGYGLFGGSGHITRSNEGIAVIPMIETAVGIAALDDILQVPGIDAIFFGPMDLSFSMGVPGEPHHPTVKAAIADGIAKCVARGVAPGVLVLNEADIPAYVAAGVRYLPCGLAGTLATVIKSTAGRFKAAAGVATAE